MELTHQFSSLFTETASTANLTQHHIKITSEEPVRSNPYPVPCSLRASLKKDVCDMIKMGVIRESNSPAVCVASCSRKDEQDMNGL